MSDTVLYDLRDGVATLTLNRPEVLNALTEELLDDLAGILEAARGDNSVRALILTGAGRAFCAGQDLESIRGAYNGGRPDFQALLQDHHHRALRAIRALEKPVIAAVNGVAAGAGMSFACACDLRVASNKARFTTAFTKIGLVPDGAMTYSLPRLVGLSKATELCLLSEMVSAEEALSIGLVNRVVPADDLLSAAGDLAGELAKGPTRAYGLTKKLLEAAMSREFDDLLSVEAKYQVEAGATEDHGNAVAAFLNKQPPVFQGR
ncbi:MAG: enoyl-CoA hydratase-related protein [Dehalococcoidia bacterium]